MGCDYYHEAIRANNDGVDESELSDKAGEFELVLKVYDGDSNQVEEKRVSVEIPVGGKLYIDRAPERPPIWSR